MSPSAPFTFAFPAQSTESTSIAFTSEAAQAITTGTASDAGATRATVNPIVQFHPPPAGTTAISTLSANIAVSTSAGSLNGHSTANSTTSRSSVISYRARGGLNRAMAEREQLRLVKAVEKMKLKLESQKRVEQEKEQQAKIYAEAKDAEDREKAAKDAGAREAAARAILAPIHNATTAMTQLPDSGRGVSATGREKLLQSNFWAAGVLHHAESKPSLYRTLATQREKEVDSFSEVQSTHHLSGRNVPFFIELPLEFFMANMDIAPKDGDMVGYTNDYLVGSPFFWAY